jgi:hypothetical protein
MGTIKSYTDLEQSKALAKIIRPESADFCWGIDAETLQFNCSPYPCPWKDYTCKEYYVPCWSLAALLDVIPCGQVNKMADSNKYEASSWNDSDFEPQMYVEGFDNPIDACYELIIKLHELKML